MSVVMNGAGVFIELEAEVELITASASAAVDLPDQVLQNHDSISSRYS